MHFFSPVRTLAALAAVAVIGGTSLHAAVEVDAKIAQYKPVSGISGNLNSIGSDTLNNLMTYWAEGFQEVYPNVKIQIEGKGSSTAPPALITGTAQLGPMSREMKKEESDAFEKKYGYKPTAIKVAIDALAIFTHKDNPLKSLTMQQADSIFSSTFKRGGKNAEKWSDLGQKDMGGKEISIYGRNSASGTYGYFKEVTLKGGDYKSTVKEQPGSSAVVQGVSSDEAGIGYSGIGYVTSGVHTVALGEDAKSVAEPSYENCLNGSYPLARFLYIYINVKPAAQPDPLVAEFIKYIASKDGQTVVVKDGYYPLTSAIVDEVHAAIK